MYIYIYLESESNQVERIGEEWRQSTRGRRAVDSNIQTSKKSNIQTFRHFKHSNIQTSRHANIQTSRNASSQTVAGVMLLEQDAVIRTGEAWFSHIRCTMRFVSRTRDMMWFVSHKIYSYDIKGTCITHLISRKVKGSWSSLTTPKYSMPVALNCHCQHKHVRG